MQLASPGSHRCTPPKVLQRGGTYWPSQGSAPLSLSQGWGEEASPGYYLSPWLSLCPQQLPHDALPVTPGAPCSSTQRPRVPLARAPCRKLSSRDLHSASSHSLAQGGREWVTVTRLGLCPASHSRLTTPCAQV